MEIKIDMNGSDVELATFLHGLARNHSQKEQSAVKTANTKKKRPPEESPEDSPGTGPDGRHPG